MCRSVNDDDDEDEHDDDCLFPCLLCFGFVSLWLCHIGGLFLSCSRSVFVGRMATLSSLDYMVRLARPEISVGVMNLFDLV